jgi:uncharacterized peroxidase-related enzyme
VIALVQALHRGVLAAEERPRVQGPAVVREQLKDCILEERDRALLDFVIRLTLSPRSMTREALGDLIAAGFSERLAHDVVHVVACFSYMNRLADGLGVVVSPALQGWATKLYGDEAWQAHRAWGAQSPG